MSIEYPPRGDMTTRYREVHARATAALGTPEQATRWLAKPNRAIGGQAPQTLLDDDVGTAIVLQILERIEHGLIG